MDNKINEHFNSLDDTIIKLMNGKIKYSIEQYDFDNIDSNEILRIYNIKTSITILKTSFELLGTYDPITGLFQWSSCDQLVNMKMTKIAKQIKSKSNIKDLEELIISTKEDNIELLERLLYYFSNNIFFIQKDNILDLLKYILYINKNIKGILKKTVDNIVVYYLITDIISYCCN